MVQAAGPAAPLTFAIGTVAMALVALSFIAFTHRVAHAGSAYAYIAHTFGSRMGFIAGWTLLLTYLGFATGIRRLGRQLHRRRAQGLRHRHRPVWIAIGGGSMVLAWWLAYRDMRLAGRLMLALEAVAVLGIIGLCIAHPACRCIPRLEQTAASFRPSADFNGWAGLGFGMVFSILCFAGFEGAATLGEETINPRRNIPIALFGTVLGSGIFFVFVAYCEVIGFGPHGIKDLAQLRRRRSMIWRCAMPRRVWRSRSTWPPPPAASPACWAASRPRRACCSRWAVPGCRRDWPACIRCTARRRRRLAGGDSDPRALPGVGAVRGRRQLLQLRQHHRRARA